MIILVTAMKQWGGKYNATGNETEEELTMSDIFSMEKLKMNDWFYFWVGANVVSYGMYFIIGGFLHVSFII